MCVCVRGGRGKSEMHATLKRMVRVSACEEGGAGGKCEMHGTLKINCHGTLYHVLPSGFKT